MKHVFEWVWRLAKKLIYEKTKAFVSFFSVGLFGTGSILFANVSAGNLLVIEFVGKSLLTILIAFATGFAGALGKDYADFRKEKRKKKQEGEKFKDQYVDTWRKNGTHN